MSDTKTEIERDVVSAILAEGYRQYRGTPEDGEVARGLPCDICGSERRYLAFKKCHGEAARGFGTFTYRAVAECTNADCGHQCEF